MLEGYLAFLEKNPEWMYEKLNEWVNETDF